MAHSELYLIIQAAKLVIQFQRKSDFIKLLNYFDDMDYQIGKSALDDMKVSDFPEDQLNDAITFFRGAYKRSQRPVKQVFGFQVEDRIQHKEDIIKYGIAFAGACAMKKDKGLTDKYLQETKTHFYQWVQMKLEEFKRNPYRHIRGSMDGTRPPVLTGVHDPKPEIEKIRREIESIPYT